MAWRQLLARWLGGMLTRLGAVVAIGATGLALLVPVVVAVRTPWPPNLWSLARQSLAIAFVLLALTSSVYYFSHVETEFRLDALGFDPEGMSASERTQNVAANRREEAIALDRSRMGVAWQLSALMVWALIALPYQCVAMGSIYCARFWRHAA